MDGRPTEMTRLRELGHLQLPDLIWREGLANWVPTALIFESWDCKAVALEGGCYLRKKEPKRKRIQ